MRNLKRALSLTMTAAMISSLVVTSGAASYSDVATDKHNVEAIEVLKAVNIMEGDTDGNFNPDKVVTRNEIAVIMSKLMAYNVASYAGTSPFTDVPQWAEPYVAACYTNGITAGVTDTTYGGDQEVTTAQAALMVMKALGYFQYQSDFGSDWQLATVSQGNKIDLFLGVDSGVKEGMPRNDVAQLVLNALESGIVEADDDTIIVDTGDTTVSAGKVKYNYVTSGLDYAKAIDNALYDNANATSGATNGSIVQLGEKLYQGNLKKTETFQSDGTYTGITDVFGRPATIWEYQSEEVGTFEEAADHAFSAKVTSKKLYDSVGRTAVENYRWVVTIDGEEAMSSAKGWKALSDNKTDDNKDFVTKTGLTGNGTGNGVRTEVFVDAVNATVHVSLTHYYAAEVYKVDSTNGTITLANLNSYPSYTTADTNDLFYSKDFTEDQVVMYSFTKGEIQEVIPAQRMEGVISETRVNHSDDQDGDYYIVDGTKYNYNATIPGSERLVTENVKNNMVGYLDQYGYAAYIDEAAVSYDYAYVLSMGTDDDIYGNGGTGNNSSATVYARLVLADGSVKKVATDAKSDEINGLNGEQALLNHIVSYTVDKNGVYTLIAKDVDAAGSTSGSDGTRDGAVTSSGTTTSYLSVSNGVASFQAPDNASTTQSYTMNSNTVFIVADTNKKIGSFDEYDFTVYTGVKNVPDMEGIDLGFTYDHDNDASTSNVQAYTKVAVAADQYGVAKVVYIQDADVSGVGNVAFAIANQNAKRVHNDVLGYYREIDAVVDGESVTLKVKEGSTAETLLTKANNGAFAASTDILPLAQDAMNRTTKGIVALETITYDEDGLVTNVRLYDHLDGNNDGTLTFSDAGTDKTTQETVQLGGTRLNGKGTRYAWYDDVKVVRYNTETEKLYASSIGSVKQDTNDVSMAVLGENVLAGLVIVEYPEGAGSTTPGSSTTGFGNNLFVTLPSNLSYVGTPSLSTTGNLLMTVKADAPVLSRAAITTINYEVYVNGNLVEKKGDSGFTFNQDGAQIRITGRVPYYTNGDKVEFKILAKDTTIPAWEVDKTFNDNTITLPADDDVRKVITEATGAEVQTINGVNVLVATFKADAAGFPASRTNTGADAGTKVVCTVELTIDGGEAKTVNGYGVIKDGILTLKVGLAGYTAGDKVDLTVTDVEKKDFGQDPYQHDDDSTITQVKK